MTGLPKWAIALYNNAKKRALFRKIEFTITLEDIANVVERADGRCELTEIPFDFGKQTTWKRRPWAPSLDRIKAEKGYLPDNIRLVCIAANFAMNAWGEEVLREIAEGMLGLTRDSNRKALANMRARSKGLRGVTLLTDVPRHKPFRAGIVRKGKKYELGLFATEEEAHEAYNKAAIALTKVRSVEAA